MQKMSREMRHKRNRSKRIWRKCVSAMACIVVFCVTYALILPAITLEKDTFCGIEAHVHEDACYAGSVIVCDPAADTGLPVLHTHDALCYDGETLICQLAELSGHVHTDACYETVTVEAHTHDENCSCPVRGQLICALAEEAGHVHTDACFVPGETLLCTETEREGHSHADACYQVESQLTCSAEEGEEHTHGDDCYTEVKTLTCQIPEDPGHTHTGSCYEQVLGCGLEEKEGHTHEDICFEMVSELICGKEEIPETVTYKNLICGMAQIAPHTHQDGCTDEDGNLICTIRNAVTHQHTEECIQPGRAEENLICGLEAHTHSLICYSDPTADLETAQDWEKTFADLELTGNWRQDVVAIAQTQLGYEESTKNYTLEGEDTKGYTRYGDWYGIPYGDWCAMFVSFCLDYAGVEGMPLDCNCPNWINTLTEANLYHVSGGYAPQSGDLIFFDWNANDSSDHVGIVVEFIPAEGDAPATVRTIEGNAGNCVKYNEYNMDDATIMGYGSLPAQLTEEERAQVDHVIALIDAMPSADEIDAKVEEFAASGDEDGETAWLEQVYGQVAEAYYYYEQLGETLQAYVTNADKLLELEYIWSVTPYLTTDKINSDSVYTVPYATTSEFVELNVFDYYGSYNTPAGMMDINNRWNTVDEEYPGYQWNAGAYPYRFYSNAKTSQDSPFGWIANRNLVDCIDFGNSLITDYVITDTLYVPDTSSPASGDTYYYKGDAPKSKIAVASSTAANGAVNAIVWGGGLGNTDRPIGLSSSFGASVAKELGSDGYPQLVESAKYGKSLKYLFYDDPVNNFVYADKKNVASVDGLFQQDAVSGAYYFDSRRNHAQYDDVNDRFVLYDQTVTPNFILYPFGNFLPFTDITNRNEVTQVQAFDYNGGVKDYFEKILGRLDAVPNKNLSQVQLYRMLTSYKYNWLNWADPVANNNKKWNDISAADAINDYFNNSNEFSDEGWNFVTDQNLQNILTELYNIDFDVATNFFFGMEMKMNFMQPKGGMTGNDNNNDGQPDYPMEFYFAGDDDVWVFIDGVMFLDLTGIHRHVGGEIDFVNGVVNYYSMESYVDGAVTSKPFLSVGFEDIVSIDQLQANGTRPNDGRFAKNLNGKAVGGTTAYTFKDYTSHSFNFYYMERGSGSSVCRINFNFPLLRQNTISVTKENVTTDGVAADEVIVGNPDYYFNLMSTSGSLFVGPNSVTGVSQYKVEDSDGNILKNADGTDKIFTTDQYGIFTLKAGQTAYFEGIKENTGKYYVQELIREEDNAQYPLVYVNEVVSQYNDLIDWSKRAYFSDSDDDPYTGPDGYKWYGRSGYYTDPSTNASFHFEQQNRFDVAKLGKLQITKKLIEAVPTRAITYYKMYVTLDGEPLPKDTTYDVNGQTRTVTEAGYIEIAAGETATISNVISGTAFEVREDAASAAGYTVKYEVDGRETGASANGVIHIGNSDTAPLVSIQVTNSDQGAQLEIPFTKSFSKSDGLNRDFTFTLEQVDASGNVISGGASQNVTITTPEVSAGVFKLTYFAKEFDVGQTKLYYKITETGVTADTLPNSQAFIAEVTVTKAEGNTEITTDCKIYPQGGGSEVSAAAFVNTLTGDLKLEKFVDGGTEAQTSGSFNFTIKLESGDSGVALKDKYPVTITQASGKIVPSTFTVNDGVITVNDVHHGESIVIHDLPIGTTWTIEETLADGYKVKTTVTVGEKTTGGTGTETNGTIVAGDTTVLYTNQQLYELPETGGTGTHVYTMAGLMLMLIGTAYLLYRYRKRRREVS